MNGDDKTGCENCEKLKEQFEEKIASLEVSQGVLKRLSRIFL